MRPRTACTICRRRQRRCISTKGPLNPCTYCDQRNLTCSLTLEPSEKSVDKTSQSGASVQRHHSLESSRREELSFSFASPGDNLELPPDDVCLEILSDYFTLVHEPSHHLFHKPSFFRDFTSGELPRGILLCVIALAARFSTNVYFHGIEPRLRGDIYAKEAGKHLDFHNLSLVTVRTAILLGAFYGADGNFMLETLYYTIACRTAGLLHVPDLFATTALERELHIRLWWTLEMIDVWSSNNAQMPRLLHPRDDVPLPIDDFTFNDLNQTQSPHDLLAGSTIQFSASILAEKIKLNSILAEIAHLNRASAEGTMSSFEIRIQTEELTRKLTAWRQQLPLELINTPENLVRQAASGLGGGFVALYLGYYHFAQLLYYRYLHLPSLPEDVASPGTTQLQPFAEQCYINSTALCETLYNAYSTQGTEVYYSMVGHVLVIASTVQLHILLFSNNEVQIRAARQRLERNFAILCQLQTLWRTLDISFGRFREFHNACMRVKQSAGDARNAFRLDKWMVGFLMEFSKPIQQRPEEVDFGTDPFEFLGSDVALEEVETEFDLRQWSLDTLGIDVKD